MAAARVLGACFHDSLVDDLTSCAVWNTAEVNDTCKTCAAPYPVRPPVPFVETTHDRITIEIARGCTEGCRFCQAGMIYRPVRERPPREVLDVVDHAVRGPFLRYEVIEDRYVKVINRDLIAKPEFFSDEKFVLNLTAVAVEAASTATRLVQPGGSTSSRYAWLCCSNSSQQGSETTRAFTPSAASNAAASNPARRALGITLVKGGSQSSQRSSSLCWPMTATSSGTATPAARQTSSTCCPRMS